MIYNLYSNNYFFNLYFIFYKFYLLFINLLNKNKQYNNILIRNKNEKYDYFMNNTVKSS